MLYLALPRPLPERCALCRTRPFQQSLVLSDVPERPDRPLLQAELMACEEEGLDELPGEGPSSEEKVEGSSLPTRGSALLDHRKHSEN